MKKTLIFSAVLALMLGACNSSSNKNEQTNSVDSASTSTTTSSTAGTDTSQTFTLDTTALASGATFYQCEMNPEVLSDKSGTCPKCGMELSEMKKQ